MAPPGFYNYLPAWDKHVEDCHIRRESKTSTEYDEMIVAIDIYLRKLQRATDKKKVAAILKPKISNGSTQ